MLAISPTRKFKVQSTVDETVSITFRFIADDKIKYSSGDNGITLLWRSLKDSIIEVEGVTNAETGEPVELTEDVKDTIFSWMRNEDESMFEKVLELYEGLSSKKSKSGVSQQASGIGDQATVKDVN
jgi:hypothetical protein